MSDEPSLRDLALRRAWFDACTRDGIEPTEDGLEEWRRECAELDEEERMNAVEHLEMEFYP